MTTVKAIRLTDYQIERLENIASSKGIPMADVIRTLIDNLIEGRIDLDTNVKCFKDRALKEGISTQKFLEIINESIRDTE